MIRFALFSNDRELQGRLSNILESDATILLEYTEDGVMRLLHSRSCEACILHLSSAVAPIQSKLHFARKLIEAGFDVFIAADKGFEWSAVEIVHLGGKGYFRNDGIFRTLRETLLSGSCSKSSTIQLRPSLHGIPEYAKPGGLIGSGPLIQKVTNLIRLVADLDVPVFIHGETGTGKELIARAIHNSSSRALEPFVPVSCGAIPETLLEAELFGHEKGAFTGTVGTRQGNLEEAGAGTLFFDEIGELSIPAQVKLLRVFQQCEFRRLGSNRLIPLRARLIFATHQDLDEMVAQGRFRQDLFYRIHVLRIDAPPLREHPEDIPELVDLFLDRYSKKFSLPKPGIATETICKLQEYSWPGNVRELEHVIQSAIVVRQGDHIGPQDLPTRLKGESQNVVDIGTYLADESFDQQLASFKLKVALAAVRQNHGNKTLAARSLNISRPYLHRLLRLGEDEQFEDGQCPQLGSI